MHCGRRFSYQRHFRATLTSLPGHGLNEEDVRRLLSLLMAGLGNVTMRQGLVRCERRDRGSVLPSVFTLVWSAWGSGSTMFWGCRMGGVRLGGFSGDAGRVSCDTMSRLCH